MEPICFKVPRQKEETVRVEYWDLPYFYRPIHFHEEAQLTYIIESNGIMLIGDKLDNFNKGEIFLIGKNVPHVFHHKDNWYDENSLNHARAVSVFFNQLAFERIFENLPESFNLKKLLENSVQGIKLGNEISGLIIPKMMELLKSEGLERVFELLEILRRISTSTDIKFLTTNTNVVLDEKDSAKLDKVFEYIITNHREKVTLEEVAELVCMTPTSFCRYFKSRTQKTFSVFLSEVRISNACKLLGQNSYNVGEACYASGYNNISNFHRQFLSITGMTPNQFRRRTIKSDAI